MEWKAAQQSWKVDLGQFSTIRNTHLLYLCTPAIQMGDKAN
jgi:hypothetical protein